MSAPLVEVKTISKTYTRRVAGQLARHKALNNVSFLMTKPERVGLIGPSGSGKSTLLRSISGLHTVDRGDGSVAVLGRTVQAGGRLSHDVRAIRANLGLIAQQFNLVPRLSLFTNAALGLLGRVSGVRGLLGLWSAEEKRRVMAALDQVGVAHLAGQRANTLSGGQQQRGAIARAIVQQAQVVLADEPVASLDPVSARKVMKLLVDLNERTGVGVVVTLHHVDYARLYCTRILALKDGSIVYDGPPDGLDDSRLRDIYGAEYEDAHWEEPNA